MKLNTKRTVLIGFAFLSISAFWQMYDNLVPKILTEVFGIGESISGIIMASDNVLALFLLPLFGGLSDKCTHRLVLHLLHDRPDHDPHRSRLAAGKCGL